MTGWGMLQGFVGKVLVFSLLCQFGVLKAEEGDDTDTKTCGSSCNKKISGRPELLLGKMSGCKPPRVHRVVVAVFSKGTLQKIQSSNHHL